MDIWLTHSFYQNKVYELEALHDFFFIKKV